MFSRKKFPIGKVAAGFAIGAISGAVIALLFAPQSGRKLQKKIVDVTEGLMDKVEDKVGDVQASVRRITKA